MSQDKFFEYEYKPGEELVLRFRRPKAQALPPAVAEHFRGSVHEFLLAARALIDLALERTGPGEPPKKRTRIKVE